MATHATTRHTQPHPTRPALAAGTAPVRAPHTADFPQTADFPVVAESGIGTQCRITALTIVGLLVVVIALALL